MNYLQHSVYGVTTGGGGDLLLRRLVWLYFGLLIFEGALRKWILPELSTPLLVVRDPVAFFILILSWRRGILPFTPYLFGMIFIGIAGVFTALLFGHGNLWVAVYGARILLLHYPLIFAVGRIFTREDVIRAGKVVIWIAIPMALLIALQFFNPQSAWVNRGVGGDLDGSGFSGAMGYYRPSGTFSFTNGTTAFFGLAGAFVISFWMQSTGMSRAVLLAGTAAVLISIPLSISRSLFFGIEVSMVFALFALMRNPRFLWRTLPAVVGVFLLLYALNQQAFFAKATEVFAARFTLASESEGGLDGVLLDRYLGGMLGALAQPDSFPFFGHGIGLGTNVGSMLVTGEVLYLISEGEWGRLVGEMGLFMGLLVIALRLALSAKMSLAAYARLGRGDCMPWLLVSFGLVVLPQGQWGQPTTLGFSCLIGGLILASFRTRTDRQVASKNVNVLV